MPPSALCFALTSNGVETTRDFANRGSIVRNRKRDGHSFRRYPEGDLLAHVQARQPQFLGAVFAIVQRWIELGRPHSDETRHDFREWAQTLDRIVQEILGEAPLMNGHHEVPHEELWIDQEAYAVGCEIDKIPALFDQIPTARQWPIKADCARPETISYVCRQGFNIEGAEKWQGCVEDRIAHLKGFKQIHIHQRCKELQTEARLYSYKRDRVTGEVLPMIVDKHNHCWDAVGYALDQYIPHRGGLGVWLKL